MIDAHLHFWSPGRFRYRWLENVPAIASDFGPAQFPKPGIEGAVFVQADCDPSQAVDEADWVAGLDFPVLGIVAYAPLELGEAARSVLAELKARPLVRGVRRNAQDEPDGFMTGRYIDGMHAATEAGLSIDMCIKSHQLPEMLRALEQVPQARVILDHLGKPEIARHGGDSTAGGWAEHISTLAARPNTFCKLSGLSTEANWETWTPGDILPWLRHAIEAFGPERCLYGGDWPVVELSGGYSRWVDVVTTAVADLSEAAQQRIWSGTAREVYRL